jgi:hypothetical protein
MSSLEGMSDQTLRWKLFPFSLKGKARQWYGKAIGKQQEIGDPYVPIFA